VPAGFGVIAVAVTPPSRNFPDKGFPALGMPFNTGPIFAGKSGDVEF
jgi:hypothetical protein